MKEIRLNSDYITLGQLLKIVDIASSGGEAKYLVSKLDIKVNNEPENRRGKKLYSNTIVSIKGYGDFLIK